MTCPIHISSEYMGPLSVGFACEASGHWQLSLSVLEALHCTELPRSQRKLLDS